MVHAASGDVYLRAVLVLRVRGTRVSKAAKEMAMMMRGLTAGNVGRYTSGNAEEWGLCECGAGSDEDDGWEVPLFRYDVVNLLCASCCEDRDERESA